MTNFIEIHTLTAYPASCLVRDDANRPKTVNVGNAQRGRISSPAIKRAIRVSDTFASRLENCVGVRTQRLGIEIEKHLIERNVGTDKARSIAREIAGEFGKLKDESGSDPLEIEQLAFVDPGELGTALSLARRMAEGQKVDDAERRELIHPYVMAVDIALFGRMFASRSEVRMTAAASVMHPITISKIAVESDYYVAVDDWNSHTEDAGSAFIGSQGYYSGVFYGYISIDRDQLVRNLNGDRDLANRGIDAFLRALTTVAPTGKQASFGSKARASFALVQRTEVPRNLFAAFVKPVSAEDQLAEGISRIQKLDAEITRAYGDKPLDAAIMNVVEGVGTLDDLIAVAQG